MKSLSNVYDDFNLHADNFLIKPSSSKKEHLADRLSKEISKQPGQCVYVVEPSSNEIIFKDGFKTTLGYFEQDIKSLERLLDLNHKNDREDFIDIEALSLNGILPEYEKEEWTNIYLKTDNTQQNQRGDLFRTTRKSFLEWMDGELVHVNYCDVRKCAKYESRLSFGLGIRSDTPNYEDEKRLYDLENKMWREYLKSDKRIVLDDQDRDILHGFRHYNSNREVANSLINTISSETVRRRKNKLIKHFDRRSLIDLLNYLDEYYYDLRMYQLLSHNNY